MAPCWIACNQSPTRWDATKASYTPASSALAVMPARKSSRGQLGGMCKIVSCGRSEAARARVTHHCQWGPRPAPGWDNVKRSHRQSISRCLDRTTTQRIFAPFPLRSSVIRLFPRNDTAAPAAGRTRANQLDTPQLVGLQARNSEFVATAISSQGSGRPPRERHHCLALWRGVE